MDRTWHFSCIEECDSSDEPFLTWFYNFIFLWKVNSEVKKLDIISFLIFDWPSRMFNNVLKGSSCSISTREDLSIARISIWTVGSSETTWICVPISMMSCLTMSIMISIMLSPYSAICVGATTASSRPTMSSTSISSSTTSKTSINNDWTKH